MPQETRKILFREDELKTAAVDHCRRTHMDIPSEKVDGLRVGAHPANALSLRFAARDPSLVREVRLDRTAVGEALIRYCKEMGIPLPKKGEKSVQAEGDAISLTIRPEGSVKAA